MARKSFDLAEEHTQDRIPPKVVYVCMPSAGTDCAKRPQTFNKTLDECARDPRFALEIASSSDPHDGGSLHEILDGGRSNTLSGMTYQLLS